MSDHRGSVGRRLFLSGVGAAGAAVVGAAAVGASIGRTGASEAGAISGAISASNARGAATTAATTTAVEAGSLYGLASGARVDRWTVAAIHPTRMGAVPVVLSTEDGERFQVDVLRRDPESSQPLGIGNTAALSLFLANRGDGATSSNEEHGLGAMALAAELTRREAAHTLPDELMTMRARGERFPTGAYTVALS